LSAREHSEGGARIVDLAGRSVTLPAQVNRVVSLHPLTTHVVWRLAPNKLMNMDRMFQARVSKFPCPPADRVLLQSLPVTGVYSDSLDQDLITSLRPDLIVSVANDPNIDKYQPKFGCQAIAVSKATLDACSASFELIGKAVGNLGGGYELAAYWNGAMRRVAACTGRIPASTRLKVYYASHDALLTTPGTSTIMSSILNLAAAIGFSAANPGSGIAPTDERGAISLEQLVAWDPDVIVTSNSSLPPQIVSDPRLRGVGAVVHDRVYANPPEASLDGVKSLMGLVWISTLLYPKTVTLDYETEAQTYYALFNKSGIKAQARPAA